MTDIHISAAQPQHSSFANNQRHNLPCQNINSATTRPTSFAAQEQKFDLNNFFQQDNLYLTQLEIEVRDQNKTVDERFYLQDILNNLKVNCQNNLVLLSNQNENPHLTATENFEEQVILQLNIIKFFDDLDLVLALIKENTQNIETIATNLEYSDVINDEVYETQSDYDYDSQNEYDAKFYDDQENTYQATSLNNTSMTTDTLDRSVEQQQEEIQEQKEFYTKEEIQKFCINAGYSKESISNFFTQQQSRIEFPNQYSVNDLEEFIEQQELTASLLQEDLLPIQEQHNIYDYQREIYEISTQIEKYQATLDSFYSHLDPAIAEKNELYVKYLLSEEENILEEIENLENKKHLFELRS